MTVRPAGCPICADNAAADAGTDPWAVARLETGYVRLSRVQYFAGSTFFLAKVCVRELHDLDRATRATHLYEMSEVAAAVFSAFGPRKMNYEALGNEVPHLHWWLTPRYPSDQRPEGPIWEDPEFQRARRTGGCCPDDAERVALARRVLTALEQREVVIERAYL